MQISIYFHIASIFIPLKCLYFAICGIDLLFISSRYSYYMYLYIFDYINMFVWDTYVNPDF